MNTNSKTEMLLDGYEKGGQGANYKPLKEKKRIFGMNVKKDTTVANVLILMYLPAVAIATFAFVNAQLSFVLLSPDHFGIDPSVIG